MDAALRRMPDTKLNHHKKTPFAAVEGTDARFHRINIDVVGPLSQLRGHRFLLTCMDRSLDGVKRETL